MGRYKPAIEFGIIGLGRFGSTLAFALAEAGREILVLDNTESKIKQIRTLTDNAFVVENLEKDTLEEAGIRNCETVIVCIGEQVDVSILTVLTVINMGVPRVIAKATSYEQGEVLARLGAEVVYPESDMATRLANKLISSRALDFIELPGDITVSEIRLSPKIAGKSIEKADLRKRFSLNIIALEHQGKTTTEIIPEYILNENDLIVVVGKRNNISRFESYLGQY